MSEYGPDGRPVAKTTDPVVKILIGCAIVAVGFVVLVALVGFGIGWKLTRDETPNRAQEGFLLGDETAYWSIELRPDDAGVAAALQHIHEQSQAAREEALKNSPLHFLGSIRQPNQLAQILPITIELARAPETWMVRVGFSRDAWKVRLGMKMMRWAIGRAGEGARGGTRQIDGVAVTTFPDPKGGGEFAMAMVKNRLLISGGRERLGKALDTSHGETGVRDPRIDPLHESVKLDGEDGWAFGPGPAVASFDVDASDDLRFRIAAPASSDARELSAGDRAREQARAFLPYFKESAIEIDPASPVIQPDGSWLITGKVAHVSDQLAAMFLRFSASRTERTREPESPSANPTPPSPPPIPDPRSGTPAVPKRGESPSPAH